MTSNLQVASPLTSEEHFPYLPKPQKEEKRRIVTAVVGMLCGDGIVIAADQQVSVPGHFKYHESKIEVQEGPNWAVTFAYAGSPGLAKEVKNKILEHLKVSRSSLEVSGG